MTGENAEFVDELYDTNQKDKSWQNSEEGIKEYYSDKRKELAESLKGSERLKEQLAMLNTSEDFYLNQLKIRQRENTVENPSKKDDEESLSNKEPEIKVDENLKPSITKEEFDKLSDEEKLKYNTKPSPLADIDVQKCVECINKLMPVISAIAPLQSALAPVQPVMTQLQSAQAVINQAASALSTLDSVKSTVDGLSDTPVGPLVQPIKSLIDSVLSLIKSLITIGYVIYTQAPKIYKQVKDGYEEFMKKKDEIMGQLEKAKELKEKAKKVLDKEKKEIEEATKRAKEDKLKTYVKVVESKEETDSEQNSGSEVQPKMLKMTRESTQETTQSEQESTQQVVITKKEYDSLSEEEKKKYKEEPTSDKILRYVKQVELPSELKNILNSANSMVDSVSTLVESAEAAAEAAKIGIEGLDTGVLINQALSILDIEIPTFEEIMASAIKDAESAALMKELSSITDKLGSISPGFDLRKLVP